MQLFCHVCKRSWHRQPFTRSCAVSLLALCSNDFPPQKTFHWVIATSNFSTAWLCYSCTKDRWASGSGVWCHLLGIWHFHSKPAWAFPPSWLSVGFPEGFVSPSSLQVFLLNGAPESTQKRVQLLSLRFQRVQGQVDLLMLSPLTILTQAFVIALLRSELFNYSAVPLKSISNVGLSLFSSADF